jgi:hypothetical protein
MRIKVNIAAVDGETAYFLDTTNAAAAMAFLDAHDHEGSSINIDIDVDDNEDVYKTLRALITR